MFEYCLQKSFNELEISYKEALKNDDKQISLSEINYRIGTHLYWLISTWDRLSKKRFNENDKKLLSALRYVYNAIKHNYSIVTISKHKPGGMTFPYHYPLIIPAQQFLWSDIPFYGRNKDQYDNYQNTLKGINVIITLQKANDILSDVKRNELNDCSKKEITDEQ